MKTLKGIPISGGIAMGTVCLYLDKTEDNLPHYSILPERVEQETARFDTALESARSSMQKMVIEAEKELDRNAVDIFKTHLMILGDPGLREKVHGHISSKLTNAEHAVSDVFEQYTRRYRDKGGHFKELVHDFIDTKSRILDSFNIDTGSFKCQVGERQPVIVASKILTPSMILRIPREHILAFVTDEGGLTSHATILARALGVPIVFGIDVEENLDCGTKAVIDGSMGKVIINPDEKTLLLYSEKMRTIEKRKRVCIASSGEPSRTRKGKRIQLKLNINTPEESEAAKDIQHDGVGLLRTEFLFMSKQSAPDEETQYRMYSRVMDASPDKPVTVRLLDLAPDKIPPYLDLPDHIDPGSGIRGAFAVENFTDIYILQLKALLRANTHSNLQLLYPMVSDLGDLATYRSALGRAKEALRKERVHFNGNIREGVMIETPASVMLARELLDAVDFVNIGSNDLLQYTLATERGSLAVEKRYHNLHPSLLRMMQIVSREARGTGKEVCLCGEIASFEEFYGLFLAIGLKSFSVSLARFPDIKCALLHLKESGGAKRLREFYSTRTKEELDKYFGFFT